MEAHFGYHIQFVMNVTDIDDKIINRARRNHLRDRYLSSTPDDSKVGHPASGKACSQCPRFCRKYSNCLRLLPCACQARHCSV